MAALNGNTLPDSVYVALDARPKKDEYHWAIVVTNTHNAPDLYHASNLTGPWQFLTRAIRRSSDFSMALIVLVKVGTVVVENKPDISSAIQQVPADDEPSRRTGEAFSCRIWAKDALAHLAASGSAVLEGDVDALEEMARRYAADYAARAETGEGATIVNSPTIGARISGATTASGDS
ncbi:hypothetical protein C8A05DRAFT_37986 [Staphylotrichum tortipilum]|uniref:Uncharacterized protein n=1 Tax=Staphylotrichum tortipilum TaxID=2831512 RepID=A0AAN6MCU7_9PEZI|nr:hypothetical protein C8A05DRAFT_37986 [Staphylotrichum longicolle]